MSVGLRRMLGLLGGTVAGGILLPRLVPDQWRDWVYVAFGLLFVLMGVVKARRSPLQFTGLILVGAGIATIGLRHFTNLSVGQSAFVGAGLAAVGFVLIAWGSDLKNVSGRVDR